MKEDEKQGLLELSEQVLALENDRHTINKMLSKLAEQQWLIKCRKTLEVSQARDEWGKPVYSNQKMRDAAIALALANDDEYQALRQESDKFREERRPIEDRIRLLHVRVWVLMHPAESETETDRSIVVEESPDNADTPEEC